MSHNRVQHIFAQHEQRIRSFDLSYQAILGTFAYPETVGILVAFSIARRVMTSIDGLGLNLKRCLQQACSTHALSRGGDLAGWLP